MAKFTIDLSTASGRTALFNVGRFFSPTGTVHRRRGLTGVQWKIFRAVFSGEAVDSHAPDDDVLVVWRFVDKLADCLGFEESDDNVDFNECIGQLEMTCDERGLL